MLRTLLTPLKARFETPQLSPGLPVSPRSLTVGPNFQQLEEGIEPEDFARDVLTQLMRNTVDNLKTAEDVTTKIRVMAEIQRIMLQDSCTKDVFRELDGFLVLMSVLSTINIVEQGQVVLPEEQILMEILQSARLVFMIASEAMADHQENDEYFKAHVGYEFFSRALQGLLSDEKTVDETMGFLLSLALHDFSISGIFKALRESETDPETTLTGFDSRLGVVRRPEALRLLWNLLPHIESFESCPNLRFGSLKLFELLSLRSHRNQAVMNSLSLVLPLFDKFKVLKDCEPGTLRDKERASYQKLLKRMLDMGASTSEARVIFQKLAKEDAGLDSEILEILRLGMKARWPAHFSMLSRANFVFNEENAKSLPPLGFSFMCWVWVEKLPTNNPHSIFSFRLPPRTLISIDVRPDGKLMMRVDNGTREVVFPRSNISRTRWAHIVLVHYPHRASNPSIRLFVDGVLNDTMNWPYPRPASSRQPGHYVLGDDSADSDMVWSMASAHLIGTPIGNDIPRLIHHLGPRYAGNFQDPALVKFLTYEASASLNMFLNTVSAKKASVTELSPLAKAIRNGLEINESMIVFSLMPCCSRQAEIKQGTRNMHGGLSVIANGLDAKERGIIFMSNGPPKGGSDLSMGFRMRGDVFLARLECLDAVLWKLGGAAVTLRIIQLANTPHELSLAIGILADGLRNSWQNSEDMERLRGYDILGHLLRSKSHIINVTSFETLFEFIGLNFRHPEQSTIVNTVAYRAICLDFELWSKTCKEVQRIYLEHFSTLLLFSRFKKFNARQRMAKLGVVRKILFVLQTDWFEHDMTGCLVNALRATAEANFSKEDAIKPIVSFLTANLHEDQSGLSSPASVISRIDLRNLHEKSEQVLECLVSMLSTPVLFTKFSISLPITRISLLLLGDRPSSLVANQILGLISICLKSSSSFARKFELVSGWSVLKTVLPHAWDPNVHVAVFNLLLGRSANTNDIAEQNGGETSGGKEVACPHIIPAILASLDRGLAQVANRAHADGGLSADPYSSAGRAEATMEVLIEEVIDLFSSAVTFRQVFKSHQITQQFVDAQKSFTVRLSSLPSIGEGAVRLLEKLNHFGISLTLQNGVAGSQKQQILATIEEAEKVINPSSDMTVIDPSLVADTRSVRQRIASVKLSMQTGEKAVVKTLGRMSEWRRTVIASERKRLRKTLLDLRENRRQVSRLQEWIHSLTSERGIWEKTDLHRTWRMDETEGPYRIRKKLEPLDEQISKSRIENEELIRDVKEPEMEVRSAINVEAPAWAEQYEISTTDAEEERQLHDDVTEDKHRRVRHELEPGDVIEAVTTVARISGVDSSPGLLILGRTHLYMLDGIVENDDGEIVDAQDAPKRLFFVPGSIIELHGPQKAQRWAHDQVASFSNRTFLFRDVALELYFRDSRSLLVVFLDKKRRLEMGQRLKVIIDHLDDALGPSILRTPIGKASSKVLSSFRPDSLSTAQRKWQAREISNFSYLSIINQLSGRTPHDATQYPIFPWVLSDYTSGELDLTSPETFRDLSAPMGALTPSRREAAHTRYVSLEGVDEKPFHYGTHFSSSMIVCHFLIRMAPFTNMFKTLQGGDWDLPDRLFSDIRKAYESASQESRGDVRELIPEFFTCPEFLENSANLDFGVLQATGEKIHDVKLPPWAKGDPLLFVTLNRKALESDKVSENLPAWIDLIWGCKQADPESFNVFHPLSYEGAIDLDAITDELEREATVGIIHNFGQTPRKLFNSAHPPRYMQGTTTLPLGTVHGIEEDSQLLVQGSRPIKDLGPGIAVCELVADSLSERIIPCPEGVLIVPLHPHEQVEWGSKRTGNAELRVIIDRKVAQIIESVFTTCAAFADEHSLVTGSSDHTVRFWRVSRERANSSPNHLSVSNTGTSTTQIVLTHLLRLHTAPVLCIAASRAWSLAISGSSDNTASLWDLNRGLYTRSITHPEPVTLTAINESTGYIATTSRSLLLLHTINARPIAQLDLTGGLGRGVVTAMAFHEREYSHKGVLATGHMDGSIVLRSWSAEGTGKEGKATWEFVNLRIMKVGAPPASSRAPGVTSLKFIGESLCHGEENGKSFMWELPT